MLRHIVHLIFVSSFFPQTFIVSWFVTCAFSFLPHLFSPSILAQFSSSFFILPKPLFPSFQPLCALLPFVFRKPFFITQAFLLIFPFIFFPRLHVYAFPQQRHAPIQVYVFLRTSFVLHVFSPLQAGVPPGAAFLLHVFSLLQPCVLLHVSAFLQVVSFLQLFKPR